MNLEKIIKEIEEKQPMLFYGAVIVVFFVYTKWFKPKGELNENKR